MNELNTIANFCRNFVNRKVDLPIRSSDMGLLIFIFENDAVTSSLAKTFFEVTKPMVSAMVKRLLQKNYIEKISDNADKRIQYLTLTEQGTQLVEESKRTYLEYENVLRNEMGNEQYLLLIRQLELANEAIRRMKQ